MKLNNHIIVPVSSNEKGRRIHCDNVDKIMISRSRIKRVAIKHFSPMCDEPDARDRGLLTVEEYYTIDGYTTQNVYHICTKKLKHNHFPENEMMSLIRARI